MASESLDPVEDYQSVATPLTPQSFGSPQYPSNVKKIPCTFNGCNKLFNRQAKLIQHLRSHTDTRPFVCPHAPCTKAYLRDSHLQHHIKSAHTQIRDYVCTWTGCGKAFATGTRFRRHIAGHEGNTKTCTIDGCGQVFRKHSTMEAHIQKVHEGIKPHVCQFLDDGGKMCGMGFDRSAQLRSHEGRMHSRNTFECAICLPDQDGNVRPLFPTYSALQEHIKADHPPTCEQCGLACTSKSALKSHIEVKHGGTSLEERKNFTCPEPGCGRGFTKKGNMNAHVQSAHSNKRYVCGGVDIADLNSVEGWDGSSACGNGFGSKTNLQEHIRTTHMGLGSRRKGNPQKTAPKTRKESAVARITGANDDRIPCTMLGCMNTFVTIHDLVFHLQARHGLADTEIQTMILAGEEDDPLFARPGFQGATAFATNEDLDAEFALDMQVDSNRDSALNMGETDEMLEGETFWLGGVSNDRTQDGGDWFHEEQEMHRLISDDLYSSKSTGGGADGMDIDPVLL